MSENTVSIISEGYFQEKGSKFYAFLHPITSIEQYKSLISTFKKQYPDACHVCSAYRLYIDARIDTFGSDDGEPNGSAGLPITNVLKRHQLINSAIFVIRIFGGSKLGIPGLIKAYQSAAEDTVENAKLKSWKPTIILSINHAYDKQNIINQLVSQFNGNIVDQSFGEVINVRIEIELLRQSEFEIALTEKSGGNLQLSS